jgi:signal transduction histidine kinase/ActR/RegA family two-component response regulator
VTPDLAQLEQRLLMLPITAKDAAIGKQVLGRAGIAVHSCATLDEVVAELDRGAGVLALAEEAVGDDGDQRLVAWLRAQPPWSDLPVLVLAAPGADSAAVALAMDRLGNVTVLERPLRIAALVSAVRTALRARQRQYQLREHLYQREHTQTLLLRAVEEMQTLLQTLPIAVFIAHDVDGVHITGNRAASELLRQPGGTNLSLHAVALDDEPSFRVCRDGRPLPAAELPLHRAARGEAIRGEEVEVRFADGSLVHGVISAMPLFDANGRPRGAIAALMDVSTSKRTELALREADRRKDEFLAILAHELRNPLAPIRNSLHILRLSSRQDPSVSAAVSEMMERQVDHMVRLVDDLLEVSRITRGKIELRREPVEIAAVLRVAVETARPLMDAAGHELAISLPPEPLTVNGDRVRLAQVFSNLLNNAAKYTDRGGHVHLVCKRDGDAVTVAVRDDGRGIPDELLPRVFDLFMQVDRGADRAQGGLGIGLTLVRSLVEMHGGRVHARSGGPGLGSEFVVRLPLCADPLPAFADPRTQLPEATGRQVLVVDDNRDAAESLAMLLRLLGMDVRVAYSGAEALAVLGHYEPEVVLLDIGMPGMDGHEVARRIREEPRFRGTTLIALTGWGQEEDRVRSRTAGFDHHLVKPADVTTLHALLNGEGLGSRRGPAHNPRER